MIELVIDVPGGTMKIVGDDQKDIFQQASFWQSLPTVCPIDGSATRLHYKNIDDYEYYTLMSSGEQPYECKLGQFKNGGGLFNKNEWVYWDAEKKQQVHVPLNPSAGSGQARDNSQSHARMETQSVPDGPPQTLDEVVELDPSGGADNPWEDPTAGATAGLITNPQRSILHALGTEYYNTSANRGAWDAKRKEICEAFGVTTSNKLTKHDAERVIFGLERRARERALEIAEGIFEDVEELDAIVRKHDSSAGNIFDCGGVPLSKVLREVKRLTREAVPV